MLTNKMRLAAEARDPSLPRVVLAGRPNVGKSTLFNRLLHRRRAITSPIPGVTHDAIEAQAVICGRPVCLVDTGGFKLDRGGGTKDDFDELVVQRTLETIQNADVLILLFAAGEITSEDEEFINLLRPLQDKIIACVNKTEGGRRVAESYNMFAYGFDALYFVSAEHGDNLAELTSAIAQKLAAAPPPRSEDRLPEAAPAIKIALAGKPNTGKSTLSNRLTSSSASLVSGIPGTTRDVVEGAFAYKGQRFITLDTAGMRRKSAVSESIEYYSVNRAIKTLDEADVVILVINADEGLSEQDKKIAALASERGRGVIFALNKWDLMPQVKNTFTAVCDRLRFLFPHMSYAPVVPISAKTGDGIAKLLDTALILFKQLNLKTETALFNSYLTRWQNEYPPPSGPSNRFKIRYGLQIAHNPVIFKLFVSRPRVWTERYGAYICNKLRQEAGYAMIPLRLEIAPSREERHKRGAITRK